MYRLFFLSIYVHSLDRLHRYSRRLDLRFRFSSCSSHYIQLSISKMLWQLSRIIYRVSGLPQQALLIRSKVRNLSGAEGETTARGSLPARISGACCPTGLLNLRTFRNRGFHHRSLPRGGHLICQPAGGYEPRSLVGTSTSISGTSRNSNTPAADIVTSAIDMATSAGFPFTPSIPSEFRRPVRRVRRSSADSKSDTDEVQAHSKSQRRTNHR